jgi:hypothetical protein
MRWQKEGVMNQTLNERLAKAALAEISHLEWEMLDEQQKAQMYKLVDRFSETPEARCHDPPADTGDDGAHRDCSTFSLLEKALVSKELVVLGLVTALFSHGNKSRWKR